MAQNKKALRISAIRALTCMYSEFRTYALNSDASRCESLLINKIAQAYAEFARNDAQAVKWFANMLYAAKDTLKSMTEAKLVSVWYGGTDNIHAEFSLTKNIDTNEVNLQLLVYYNRIEYVHVSAVIA